MKVKNTFVSMLKSNLDETHNYAEEHSTCAKVVVGSMIYTRGGKKIFGCNHGVCNCKENGCRRVKLYGENSKEHRLPSDCDSIHSEVDAICNAARSGVNINRAIIYVTRYPCEACARAIVSSGISTVVYGREQCISEYTKEIFKSSHVKVLHIKDWRRDDVTT